MKKIVFAVILIGQLVYAQNLDSLYQKFVAIKNRKALNANGSLQVVRFNNKCGLGIINSVKENIDNFSPERQISIQKMLARPAMQTSIVTPANRFRIHYDTVGVNKPGYSVEEFAAALDSAYEFEVNVLGYPPAPGDNGAGGDDLYDFYIEDLPNGLYGATTPEASLGNGRSTAYTEIDNDFAVSEGYYTFGIEAAKVTAAHEYHHAIQIGNYINRYSQDGFYYEITSTAMEEFTFDEVNDYYFYMRNYFNHPELTLSQFNGYDLAILNIFFAKEFDHKFLRRIWELMITNRAIEAIALAAAERGSTIGYEFNQFGIWTYFTGYRAVPNVDIFFDYDEAKNYPLVVPAASIEFIPPKKTVTLNSAPVSNMFLFFTDFTQGAADSLVSIITNSDVSSAVNSPNGTIALQYSLTTENQAGAQKINDRYYSVITSSQRDMFVESNIFNNTPVNSADGSNEIDYAYPQPFAYSRNSFIYIPAFPDPSGTAELNVFTTSMDLVYSAPKIIYSIDKVVVQWNALDNAGNRLPSGIYIYAVKSGDQIKKGKLVIFNE